MLERGRELKAALFKFLSYKSNNVVSPGLLDRLMIEVRSSEPGIIRQG